MLLFWLKNRTGVWSYHVLMASLEAYLFTKTPVYHLGNFVVFPVLVILLSELLTFKKNATTCATVTSLSQRILRVGDTSC